MCVLKSTLLTTSICFDTWLEIYFKELDQLAFSVYKSPQYLLA